MHERNVDSETQSSFITQIYVICSMTTYEPLILCLSCNKWSCGTYQNCWKEWNTRIRQRCYRESTYCQSTDTERHMWDSINCIISAEWWTQKLWWSCFNFKLYKYYLKDISGEWFSCNYACIICFQVEIKQMGILSKDFWPLTNTPDYLSLITYNA